MLTPFSMTFSQIPTASWAYSLGLPSLDGNGTLAASDSRASSGYPSNIGVWNRPGRIAATRMPSLARSRATGNVIACTPPFEAE